MSCRQERGLILPALALLLVVGTLTLGLALHQRTTSAQLRMQATTAATLGQARALLRDYAQAYGLTHANQAPGYLPCPDLDGDGSAEPDCPPAGQMAVGLFPYRTLGMPPLRDGHGECLWYAVADRFKANPKAPGALMNWDTAGQFVVAWPSGQPVFPVTRPTDRAAAVVIAPGPVMPGQNRPDRAGRPCVAPGLTDTVRDRYLESTFATPAATTIDVATASADADTTNDQVSWLQPADIFDAALLRRAHLRTAVIDAMIIEAKARFNDFTGTMLPPPSAPQLVGTVEAGRLPALLTSNATTNAAYLFREWIDQFRYLRCLGGVGDSCLARADGALCRGVLLFAGSRTDNQNRAPGTDADYFESNLQSLSLPETVPFFGNESFAPTAPHQDMVLCL